jgi:putative ABC transport system permease protein
MLTLIAVTSVISTISTNVRSRAREFAVLESVGMTKTGVKKMLNLESILCSVRSLVFGLPLGLFGAYALYRAMGLSVELTFRFPWLSVAECILGVFAVTWVTMRYSASRLKGGSIVETIRGE